MKYSIMGFNQEKLLQFDLSLNEVLLLSYIYDAQASPTMSHILESEKTFTWLNHSKIQTDLPILNVNERQLKYYLNHLSSYGLIASKQVTVAGIRGSRAYYGITEICESLRYDHTETEQGQKIAPNTPLLGAKNCPSDNLLNLDNKLENTIPKGIVTEVPTEEHPIDTSESLNSLSEYESKMYSEDRKKMKVKESTAPTPKKKLSLWDKCVQVINDYTDNEELRTLLTDFLKMRLSMKDKVMYAPQWKSMVEKIDRLNGNPVNIVRQSLEHGWASFYDEKTNNGYSEYRQKSIYDITSETPNMRSDKVSDEKWKEIMENGEEF